MPDPKRVSVEEARALIAEGYVYVDVRSEPEFERGHVPGAYNVPLNRRGPGGPEPNPDFLSVMEAGFGKDERLLVGCASGVRSAKAVRILADAGFATLAELRTGWDGARDAFGRLEPGWSKQGLPSEQGAPEGQRYADVPSRRAPR